MNQRSSPGSRLETCFHEADPAYPLLRRSLAEGVGTLLLMCVVTAMVPSLKMNAGESAVALLGGALAGAATLVGLVVALGSVSGGHFNPLITILQWLGRERTLQCTLAYVAAQCLGAVLGAWLGSGIVGLSRPASSASPHSMRLLGEIVATAGLLLVVFGCARGNRTVSGPFAVGTWLVAVGVAVPGCLVNPALALGSLAAPGPSALSAREALKFLTAQFAGAVIAFCVVRLIYSGNRPLLPYAARAIVPTTLGETHDTNG